MKARIIYDEILKGLSTCKTNQSQLRYVSKSVCDDGAGKKICAAMKFRIWAVSSTEPTKKSIFYKKCASIFQELSKQKEFRFLKAIYYENQGFYFAVIASNNLKIKKRLADYRIAYHLFKRAHLLAKKFALIESMYLSKGWFELTSALYCENLYYLKQNPKLIKEILGHSKSANKIFKKMKIKKLIELSQSLADYAKALKYKEAYNKSFIDEYKKKFKSMLRKAAHNITCQEFMDIKKFYLSYLLSLQRQDKNGNKGL